jgi:hypothetical protein
MSLCETAGRASYEAFLALERLRVARVSRRTAVTSFGDADTRWRVIAQRRPGQAPKFFTGTNRPETMRELFAASGPYAAQGLAARRAAAAAQQHEFHFFGRYFRYDTEIDWHRDPVTNRQWPRLFHRDVPIHNGSEAIGDVKYVWELSRHQFLIDLGKAYWLFGDAPAAAAVYAIVRHWIGANPCGVGVNWSCALEPAFRVWSWLWAYHFCASDQGLDDDTRALWLTSFNDHGRFLYRHLELYSSPYNHLIGEASALYALGILFPEMPEAAQWRRRGRRVLEAQVRSQFHRDGGSVEQSTFYHHATLGFYILAAALGEANADAFPQDVHAAIEKAIEFSMALMQPDGHLPSIGGADDGKCIRLEHLPLWDFRPFLAFGAVRYGRSDFRFAAGEFFEDALWLLGPEGRGRFLAMQPVVPTLSSALETSGYYVLRSGWTEEADYLCFDCGEQAAGLRRDDVPSAAHGHADCLSVVLWLRGRPVLVDPGFYCYNGDPAWEVHFRRTEAHNTATVDRRDQSLHLGKMAWSRVFAPKIEAWMPDGRGGAAGGSHDGYARYPAGVIHRRAVWLHDGGWCIICDQFSGDGLHEVEINYQFAPGRAELSNGSAVLFEHAELAWVGTAPVEAHLRCGESGPDGGWIAPSLGVRVPAPRLSLKSTIDGPLATYLTVVAPRRIDQPRCSEIGAASPNRLSIGFLAAGGEPASFELVLERGAESAGDLIASLSVRRDRGPVAEASVPALQRCS